MNKTVQYFGSMVEKRMKTDPARAKKLLKLGFEYTQFNFKKRPNKQLPKSKQAAAVLCMEAFLDPIKQPENSATVNLFMPCEILHSVGIKPLLGEQVACYIAGAGSEQGMLSRAEMFAVPPTTCSYHRVLCGAALSGVVGKPLFAANTSMICDANIATFRLISDHYEVPHFVIDTPMSTSDEAVQYVAEQLREFRDNVQDIVGKKITDEELSKRVKMSEASLLAYSKYIDGLAGKYLPTDLTSEMYTVLLSHNMLGTGQAKKYFEMALEDVKNAKDYCGGKRILWMHTIPNCQDSMREIFNFNEDVQMLISDLSADVPFMEFSDDPFVAMAQRTQFSAFNSEFSTRGKRAIELAQRTKADGIIMFAHWGCRNTLGGARIMESMAREAGVPLLVLDGDGCNLKDINDGKMVTAVESFLDML